jgi:hypothetical protein
MADAATPTVAAAVAALAAMSDDELCDRLRAVPAARESLGGFKGVSAACALLRAAGVPEERGGFLLREVRPLAKRVEDVMGQVVHLPPALAADVAVGEAAAIAGRNARAFAGALLGGPGPTARDTADFVRAFPA